MAEIKAIETLYKGYRFRSRLEARYAIFFDAMGIRWQYEAEGFDLGDGIYYLPDFWLPDAKQFFEVKGIMTDIDKTKIERLSSITGAYVIIGDADFCFSGCEPRAGFDVCDTHLVKCLHCGTLYFENELAYTCTACGYYDGDNTFEYVDDFLFAWDGTMIDNEYNRAIQAAKSARFEHGETPIVSNGILTTEQANKLRDKITGEFIEYIKPYDRHYGGSLNLCNWLTIREEFEKWATGKYPLEIKVQTKAGTTYIRETVKLSDVHMAFSPKQKLHYESLKRR